MSSTNSNTITNTDVSKQHKREMKDEEKRKRDDEEEGNKEPSKQAKIDKGDARPIVVFKDPVTQETLATPYTFGVTLKDIRDEYDNPKLWLYSPTLNEKCMVGTSVLQASQTYEIRGHGKVTPTASDAKSEVRQILNNIPSASTYGNPTHPNGFKSSEHPDHIKVHRCNSGTPVVLLDPILSELYDDLVNKAYIPTSEDCKSAKELMKLLSEGFTDEVRDMQPKVKDWASGSHPGGSY
eukprot:Phypoly_transcript_03964.p2 GENE.Phypoly_transcript_03964~~Phypoly_transcript_03964.p2  ORF type:complete len:238 (+),score=33.86 Phypoly_transcript_03964:315-1028(+)